MKPISARAVQILIRKICDELGIHGKVGFHSFRKNFTGKIFELSGNNIVETRKYTRHKSLGNLLYYLDTMAGTDLVNGLNWGASEGPAKAEAA